MGEHRRLARAGAGDHQQRSRPFRLAVPCSTALLLGIEFAGRARANQGGDTV